MIHNNQVIEHLESIGIKTVYKTEEIPTDVQGFCVVRTHGVTPCLIRDLKKKNCEIIDATCPDVKKVQDKAKLLAKEGCKVVIVGKADHPEVIAIKGHADDELEEAFKKAIVIGDISEVAELSKELKKHKKIGIVVQTTQKIENLKEILASIIEFTKEVKVYNTICAATSQRQQAAKDLARKSDLMVVVGSKSSANTTHLAEILSNEIKTIHVETKKDLSLFKDNIKNAQNIGVTAGASTPEDVIVDVLNCLEKGEYI